MENTDEDQKTIGAPLDTQQSDSRSGQQQFSGRGNFRTADPKMQFETFDSSREEKREEKFIFKYIQRMDFGSLESHLRSTRNKFDIMQIYDKSGYTPIHYAAYKNIDRAVEIIIKFALSEDSDRLQSLLPNAGSGETDDDVQQEGFSKSQR